MAIHPRKMAMDFRNIITIEPGKRGGKPTIRGMRITVYDILEYLASGMTEQEILSDFPYLTREDILACLQFAANRSAPCCRSSHDSTAVGSEPISQTNTTPE